jgi:uncharacterized protein YggE
MFNESIKKYIGYSVVVVLLTFAIASLSFAFSYPGSTTETGTFSVSGEGNAIVIPDIAVINFSIVSEGGDDISVVQNENTLKSNQAISFLKDQGIDSKDIKTINYSLRPRYEFPNCKSGQRCERQLVGYTITNSIQTKIRNFDLIGGTLTGLVSKGVNNLSSVNFSIDDPEEAQNEARVEAIKQAQSKARSTAKAGGFRLGRLLNVSENGVNPPVMFRAFAESADTSSATPTIEPGSEEVKVTVNLTFEIR